MKYFVLSFVLAVAAAAPQAPYNPYYANPYGAYNPAAYNPAAYNPAAAYNPYYRHPGYAHQPHPYVHPQQYHYSAPAVAETRESRPDGSYQYSYATADGQQVQSEGYLKSVAPGVETPVVTGSYSYTSPDGTPVSVSYIADEFGFRAHGPHIANAEAIEKSIAVNIESERYHQGRIPVGPVH